MATLPLQVAGTNSDVNGILFEDSSLEKIFGEAQLPLVAHLGSPFRMTKRETGVTLEWAEG